MSDLTWTNERRKLRELIPWERNPRKINMTGVMPVLLTEAGDVGGV